MPIISTTGAVTASTIASITDIPSADDATSWMFTPQRPAANLIRVGSDSFAVAAVISEYFSISVSLSLWEMAGPMMGSMIDEPTTPASEMQAQLQRQTLRALQ